MGVWIVLMSHNEPLPNNNTHHVCLPAFSLLVLSVCHHKHTTTKPFLNHNGLMCASASVPCLQCAIHIVSFLTDVRGGTVTRSLVNVFDTECEPMTHRE